MKFFRLVISVFKTYDYGDKVISGFAIAVVLMMFAKMIIFPYGFFHFGEPDIYTEGIVSKNGIQNINPLFVDYNESDREVSALVFSGLMKYDPDKNAIVDDMAKLTISEDKMEYTFTLRSGIKWSDGKPLTIDDVYFTFHDLILDPSFPNEILKTNFAGVEVVKVDDKTIKFTMDKPNVFFIANLTTGIVPKHILGDIKAYDILQADFNKNPVGSGPYMVSSPLQAFPDGRTQVTLTKNSYYYEQGPNITSIRLIAYPTMDALLEEMGIYDGIVKVTGGYIKTVKGSDRFNMVQYQLPQYVAVFLNMENSVIKDNKKVRLALAQAIDKNELVSQFVDKVPIETPIMELNQEDYKYAVNKEEAGNNLESAGYKYGKEDVNHLGIRYDSKDKALELNFIVRLYDEGSYQYEETQKIVEFLETAWKGIGFGIKTEYLPDDMFKERIMNRQYDLLLIGQSLGYNTDTYSYWHSTQVNARGQNFSNYKSFRVDSLIEDIRSVFDKDKRAKDLVELATQIKDDIPAIFLYRPVYYYATDGKVSGISMDNLVFPSDRYSKISNWTFQ